MKGHLATTVRQRKTGSNSFMLAMVLAFLLPACATQSLKSPSPPPLLNAGPAIVVPDPDLLEVTPRMEQFLESYVLDYEDEDLKRQLLSLAITDRAYIMSEGKILISGTKEELLTSKEARKIYLGEKFTM